MSYGELYERALGILYHLQKLGAKPRRQADPVSRQQRAVHRCVLGRRCSAASCRCRWRSASATSIATSCCASRRSSASRSSTRNASTLDRIGAFAGAGGRDGRRSTACSSRAFLVDELDDISRAGEVHRAQAGRHRVHPVLLGLDQRARRAWCSRTRTSSPTARGAAEAARFNEDDVSLVLDAADPRHGPHRHAHHDVREPHAAAT